MIHAKQNRIDNSTFGLDGKENIYVNEHLTRATRDLLMFAKEKLKSHGYRIKTRDCTVFVKKDGWLRGMTVFNRDQIIKMLTKPPMKDSNNDLSMVIQEKTKHSNQMRFLML